MQNNQWKSTGDKLPTKSVIELEDNSLVLDSDGSHNSLKNAAHLTENWNPNQTRHYLTVSLSHYLINMNSYYFQFEPQAMKGYQCCDEIIQVHISCGFLNRWSVVKNAHMHMVCGTSLVPLVMGGMNEWMNEPS
jgi:hypothetical protein